MRWLEKLHLDSPAELHLSRYLPSRAADLGAPGCMGNLDARKCPAPGIQVSAQSARARQHSVQENEERYLEHNLERYLVLTGARRVQRQLQPFSLLVLADGTESHLATPCATVSRASRQQASGIVIEMLFESLAPALLEEGLSHEEGAALLQEAIQSANQRLYRQQQRDQTSLGCSLAAALVTNQEASICTVGNSRAYVLSDQGHIRLKTVAHTIGERLAAAGILTPTRAFTCPTALQTYRWLGQDWWIHIDTFRQTLVSGDQLLLCSDGLWQRLDDPAIESTLREHPPLAQAGNTLIHMAQERGGLDDSTAILLRCTRAARCPRRPGIEQLASNQPLALRHGFIRTR